MLRHQLRQNLILAPDLLLQKFDAILLGLVLGTRFGLEGRAAPPSKNSFCQRSNTVGCSPGSSQTFETGSCSLAPEDGDLLLGVMLPLFFHPFSLETSSLSVILPGNSGFVVGRCRQPEACDNAEDARSGTLSPHSRNRSPVVRGLGGSEAGGR
jgi:hypothetical protein